MCVSKTVICKICVYTTKSFMGQTIDLCTMKCRGRFGEGVQDLCSSSTADFSVSVFAVKLLHVSKTETEKSAVELLHKSLSNCQTCLI